jgi:ribosomal protein RSM22 (predicted rRNA methylase)
MLDLNSLKPFLLTPEISDVELTKCIRALSEAFTIKRDKIDDLYSKERYISAYACFYMLTNIQKMNFAIERLSPAMIDSIKQTTVIEVGTGPGTYIFSLIEHLGNDLKYIGVDHSPLMLEQAKKIADGLYPLVDTNWLREIPRLKEEVTYIFGNSLNEMNLSLAMRLIEANNVSNIICIEPGTKSSFSKMGEFRELLIKSSYNVAYPCSNNSSCPIFKKKDDWCHQVIKSSLDPAVERLSQMAQLDRKTMPAIIHVYSKNSSSTSNARIIRLVKNLKHAFIWEVCSSDQEALKTFRVEVSKKTFKKKEIKELEKMSSGLEIEYEVDRIINDELIRLKSVIIK